MIQFNSCELLDKQEPIPAYIQIDTMKLQIRHPSEGTKSHKIKDAWLFVDNQLIGAFEMPMVAPVLYEGEKEIKVFAGISDNGIAATPEVYPFYNRYTTTRVLKAGETITVAPNITYDDDAVLVVEGFEAANLFGDDLDGNGETKIRLESTGRFEGLYSGKVTLNADNPIFEAATSSAYSLYKDDDIDSPVYLELNYKNNIPFEIGVMGFKNNALVDKVYVAGFNPKEEWNKVYVNLTSTTSAMKADNYKIVIYGAKDPDIETCEIFLDNVKLLHF